MDIFILSKRRHICYNSPVPQKRDESIFDIGGRPAFHSGGFSFFTNVTKGIYNWLRDSSANRRVQGMCLECPVFRVPAHDLT